MGIDKDFNVFDALFKYYMEKSDHPFSKQDTTKTLNEFKIAARNASTRRTGNEMLDYVTEKLCQKMDTLFYDKEAEDKFAKIFSGLALPYWDSAKYGPEPGYILYDRLRESACWLMSNWSMVWKLRGFLSGYLY